MLPPHRSIAPFPPLQTSLLAPGSAGKLGDRTIEQQYQKKSQLEHILLRPDSYGVCCVRARVLGGRLQLVA